jgi:endonuclease/exonuclease/phosphatase (EEP) superfamily protein YafD
MITTSSPHRELIPATAVLAIAVALAFSPDAYLPMLARAFLLQWSALFVVLAVLLLWRKLRWTALSSALGCVLILPQYHQPVTEYEVQNGHASLRIAHLNVYQLNDRYNEVLRSAITSWADVVSLQEVDDDWADALRAGLASSYPYSHVEVRNNCYGIALFSKMPFMEVHTSEVERAPFIEAIVQTNDGPVRILSVHATSPISYAHFKRRNALLRHLAENIDAHAMPTVLVGDLNTVHWDRAYRNFHTRSGLQPVNGPAMRTWPSIGPIALIPLDHLMISPGLGATDVQLFTIPGSDHRGLVADIHLPADVQRVASGESASGRTHERTFHSRGNGPAIIGAFAEGTCQPAYRQGRLANVPMATSPMLNTCIQ